MPTHAINVTTKNTEWYTPVAIVELARLVMGGIDLDPASSSQANENIVRADVFYSSPEYTIEPQPWNYGGLPVRTYQNRGGLARTWYGRVFLNHPFGVREQPCKFGATGCLKVTCAKRGWHTSTTLPGSIDWIDRLVQAYHNGAVKQAITICYASTSEAWFAPLLRFPTCFIHGRTNYLDPETLKPVSGVQKGSAVVYLGDRVGDFVHRFSKIGAVMLPAFPTELAA